MQLVLSSPSSFANSLASQQKQHSIRCTATAPKGRDVTIRNCENLHRISIYYYDYLVMTNFHPNHSQPLMSDETKFGFFSLFVVFLILIAIKCHKIFYTHKQTLLLFYNRPATVSPPMFMLRAQLVVFLRDFTQVYS